MCIRDSASTEQDLMMREKDEVAAHIEQDSEEIFKLGKIIERLQATFQRQERDIQKSL